MCSLCQRLFAALYDPLLRSYERYMRPRKEALFRELTGVGKVTVEIGPGTGANLPFLEPGSKWIGIEPNPHMRRRLAEKAKQFPIDVEFRGTSADQIDLPDNSADAVIGTLVLCSVPDVAAALAEIKRILRPGSRYVFIEHIAAPPHTWLRRWQSLARPLWQCCAAGCQLNRDTSEMIQAAGFAQVELTHFRVPTPPGIPLVSPHIAGMAMKHPVEACARAV
jgi:ubiquinone/menaquinone biosynthesis C-methylase UbiE